MVLCCICAYIKRSTQRAVVRARWPVDAKLRLQFVFNGDWENSVRFFTHKDIKMHPTGTMEFMFDNPFENSNLYSIVEQSCKTGNIIYDRKHPICKTENIISIEPNFSSSVDFCWFSFFRT